MGTQNSELSGLGVHTNAAATLVVVPVLPEAAIAAAEPTEESYDPLEDTGITNPNIQGGEALARWRHEHRR